MLIDKIEKDTKRNNVDLTLCQMIFLRNFHHLIMDSKLSGMT